MNRKMLIEYGTLAGMIVAGLLRTRLELIDIKLQRYKDLSEVRELSEAERIDLRSLEAERSVILGRLADKV